MSRLMSAVLGAAAVALGAGSLAQAQAPQAAPGVQRSGAVYHAPACPGPAAPGQARCHARIVTDIQGNPIVRPNAGGGTPSGYGPADLQSAYNVVGLTSSATIAIVDAYGYDNAEADLAVYRATFGLPPCTTQNGCFRKVNQRGSATGPYPRQNTGWAQETALDLDMVSAICPSCRIVLVEADSNSFANLAEAERTAALQSVKAISNSYGASESSGSQTYEPSYNFTNIAVTVSSGDGGYGVEFPASSPHVIAVGGTSLKHAANARGWSETTWSGAGSGCSSVYAKPSWQTDSGCARRTVADVSAVADPATGVAVYGPARGPNPGWLVFGGTSASAPLVAGVYGLNGVTLSEYGPNLYSHASSLFDVTSGSNGSCGGSYLCTAGAGYDGPTGLGTPNGPTAF